ncbi:MAG: phage/plasmid replication protein, partial [Draconibacterium sp.]
MFDNTDFNYNNTATPGINFLESIPQHLTKVTSNGITDFGEYVNGYLDSLKVKVTENRVIVKDSSICKYYLGDNFKTLSKGDYKRAIEKISDSLHLPFHLAHVTRIDFAQNFIMQHESNLYYPYLGESQYYKRLEQNNGLYYNNKKRQLLFYGKVQEQKDKRQSIPELYQNRNVLRFELRFLHRLTNQFNQPEITAGLLYDENFYRDLVKRWKNEYFNIQ